jgi:protein gp37
MSIGTGIEWTETTWNPIAGCSLVSPGCKNCYAMKMAHRLEAMGQQKYAGLTRKVNGHAIWTGKITLDENALLQPLSWKKPRRVFVNSMSDLFHPGVPFEFVDRVFAVMAVASQHVYQCLTKRPERMAEYVERTGRSIDYLEKPARKMGRTLQFEGMDGGTFGLVKWPLPNVWLGTSVEDQQRADERIPQLLNCPAAVRFLSCEPLLGPIDFSVVPVARTDHGEAIPPFGRRKTIDWVIAGGESGPRCRPCNIGWIKSIIIQCKYASIACFVKQLGTIAYADMGGKDFCAILGIKDRKGGDPEEWPEDLRVREFPVEAR